MPSQRLLQHSSRSFKGSQAFYKDIVWNLHATFILWIGYVAQMLKSFWRTDRATSVPVSEVEKKVVQRKLSQRRRSESMKDDYEQLLRIMQDCCQSGHVVLTSPPSKLDGRRRTDQQTFRRKSMGFLECPGLQAAERTRAVASACGCEQSSCHGLGDKVKRRNERILSKWVEM
eukprot:765574-Hanusia_phi.AAC.1